MRQRSAQALRSLHSRLSRSGGRVALAVFFVALANGLVWSALTPAFQVPDETAHFAYVQRLAEGGVRAGDVGRPEFSSEESQALAAVGTLGIIGRPLNRAPETRAASAAADAALQLAEDAAPRDDGGGPSTASSQPTLYYAIAAVPYRAFAWASLPARLHAIRALSAVIFAVGASLCALFVLECLPGSPGAAVIGGMAIALSPYTAFIASGVTPDTLLLTTSAGLLLSLARASRRGLTRRRAAIVGLFLGAGILTKLTFLAFVIPSLLAVLFLFWRDRERLAGRRLGTVMWFVGIGGALPVLFLTWLTLTGRSLRPMGTSTTVLTSPPASNTRELVSYAWQLFLPRPSFMNDQFGFVPLKETWIKGFAGRYGWLDYNAPPKLADFFVQVVAAVAMLCVVVAIARRDVLRRRWGEIAIAGLFCAFLWALVAKAGYDYHRTTGLIFEQPRYLFPVGAFWALGVAVACFALGRRAFPYLATLLVALMCLHNLTGLALTVERYYG